MLIYPIPVEVTQARIQLVVDQNAKAPANTIHQDLQAVYHAKAAAVEAGARKHSSGRSAARGRQGLTTQ